MFFNKKNKRLNITQSFTKNKTDSNRFVSWFMLFVTTATCIFTLISLYILIKFASSPAENNNQVYALYITNLCLLLGLGICVGILILSTYRRYKKGVFGIKLMVKLAVFFSLVGIIPGVVVYTVSYKFVSSSLDAWFEVKKIDDGIEAGIELGRKFIDRLLDDNKTSTRLLVNVYKENTLEQLKEQIIELNKADTGKTYALLDSHGELIYGTLQGIKDSMIEETKLHGQYGIVDLEEFSGIYRMRVIMPVGGINSPIHFLQMVEQLPKEWSEKVSKIEAANQQHLTNKVGRNEFTGFYITTLTISLGFAVCLSIILAFWLGNQITQPLLLLEQGTKLVASGDLRPKQEIQTNDELGLIMKGFNHMTRQLSESRLMEQRSKNRLEGILTTMTAGVILLDQNKKLLRYNKSAEELLGVSLFEYLQEELNHRYYGKLNDLLKTVYYYFRQQKKWQTEYEYIKPDSSVSYLLIKGSILKSLDEKNLLIVFDDLTEILSAQRTNAWGEVAKRLAHEIKNPLTPIQLSAERLQLKLQNKLEESEQAILDKSTNTIINQVSALKRLVDEFRNYSRLPHAILGQVDLNDLIQDVVQLYKSSNDIYWKLELNNIPDVLIDIGQIRQVLHNLIQNSQDAMSNQHKQAITITTSLSKKGVHLCVSDTGPGFDKSVMDKVFDPYITTKKTGTGLGMAIVKKVIQENHADIAINNRIDNNNNGCIMGAEVHIWFKSV